MAICVLRTDDSGMSLVWSNTRADEVGLLSAERGDAGIAKDLMEALRRARSDGETGSLPDLVRGDGDRPSEVWTRWSCVLDGDHVAVFGSDVTQEVLTELEREAMQKQLFLAQRMESIARLAGGVAHDFNNIVTVIQSYAGFLRGHFQPGDPALEDIDIIVEAGERAERLTRQLLAFSRKQIMEMRLVDLNDVVVSLQRMLHRVLGETVVLRTQLTSALDPVKADLTQMEQVIVNLLVNARDAMPDGGTVTIETANVTLTDEYAASKPVPTPPGEYVKLSITDTGVGMDRELQERVFDPFFTTKPANVGTGLGLSVVYGIVKQTGGFIWVYSEPGLGTTFKIYLPSARGAEPSQSKTYSVRPKQLEGTETVLLVEDDEAVRNAGRRMLLQRGYTVLEAASGPEALLLCERYSGAIDGLLTDVVMPKMSGRELADRVTEKRPEVAVVYMSGYADDAIVHHGILEEGVHFIHKPFTADSLLTTLRQALEEGGQRDQRLA
jgi:signal transduction histidine kinase/ActR/RegA family two-component response regulator